MTGFPTNIVITDFVNTINQKNYSKLFHVYIQYIKWDIKNKSFEIFSSFSLILIVIMIRKQHFPLKTEQQKAWMINADINRVWYFLLINNTILKKALQCLKEILLSDKTSVKDEKHNH